MCVYVCEREREGEGERERMSVCTFVLVCVCVCVCVCARARARTRVCLHLFFGLCETYPHRLLHIQFHFMNDTKLDLNFLSTVKGH